MTSFNGREENTVLNIKFKIPLNGDNSIQHIGDTNKFVNIPITINYEAVGVITGIVDSTDNYIEVEGYVWTAGICYSEKDNDVSPYEIVLK